MESMEFRLIPAKVRRRTGVEPLKGRNQVVRRRQSRLWAGIILRGSPVIDGKGIGSMQERDPCLPSLHA